MRATSHSDGNCRLDRQAGRADLEGCRGVVRPLVEQLGRVRRALCVRSGQTRDDTERQIVEEAGARAFWNEGALGACFGRIIGRRQEVGGKRRGRAGDVVALDARSFFVSCSSSKM